jgi:hypothetical protein
MRMTTEGVWLFVTVNRVASILTAGKEPTWGVERGIC